MRKAKRLRRLIGLGLLCLGFVLMRGYMSASDDMAVILGLAYITAILVGIALFLSNR